MRVLAHTRLYACCYKRSDFILTKLGTGYNVMRPQILYSFCNFYNYSDVPQILIRNLYYIVTSINPITQKNLRYYIVISTINRFHEWQCEWEATQVVPKTTPYLPHVPEVNQDLPRLLQPQVLLGEREQALWNYEVENLSRLNRVASLCYLRSPNARPLRQRRMGLHRDVLTLDLCCNKELMLAS